MCCHQASPGVYSSCLTCTLTFSTYPTVSPGQRSRSFQTISTESGSLCPNATICLRAYKNSLEITPHTPLFDFLTASVKRKVGYLHREERKPVIGPIKTVGIYVEDPAAALRFYVDTLGFDV